jgi:hypothetical protein
MTAQRLDLKRERAIRIWAKRLQCRLERRHGVYRLLDDNPRRPNLRGTVFVVSADLLDVMRRLAEMVLDP